MVSLRPSIGTPTSRSSKCCRPNNPSLYRTPGRFTPRSNERRYLQSTPTCLRTVVWWRRVPGRSRSPHLAGCATAPARHTTAFASHGVTATPTRGEKHAKEAVGGNRHDWHPGGAPACKSKRGSGVPLEPGPRRADPGDRGTGPGRPDRLRQAVAASGTTHDGCLGGRPSCQSFASGFARPLRLRHSAAPADPSDRASPAACAAASEAAPPGGEKVDSRSKDGYG